MQTGGVYYMRLTQNQDSLLNAQWREQNGGWVSIENRNLTMEWRARATGNGGTRVGLVAYCEPDIGLPAWLVALAMKIVIPDFPRDLDRFLRRWARGQ